MQRVVITGVGAVSAFGVGINALWDGLSAGQSRVAAIRNFDVSAFQTQVGAEVPVAAINSAWISDHLPTSSPLLAQLEQAQQRGLWRDRKTAFAVLAAAEAWLMAGCGMAEREAGLSLALGLEQAFLEDFAPGFTEHGIHWQCPPKPQVAQAIRYRSEVDLGAQWLTERLQLRGPNVVNVSACAAGGLAIAQAAAWIERGQATIMLCGGADSMLNPFGLGGMSRLGAPSPRNQADACRPFDRRRDGLVIGEGAAVLVLESEQRALKRGAPILARLKGYGSSQDAYNPSVPHPDGGAAQRAMQQALLHAAVLPQQIGYINAHGTGTVLNDLAEARAIRRLFGPVAEQPWLSSIKGAVGHLMAASGAIELAASLLAFQRRILPGTAHHQMLDPQCEIRILAEPTAAESAYVLSNSFGFGGQNVALVVGAA